MGLVEPGTLVLVVDDDSDVRDAIADVLAMEGYETRLFSSADAAWNAIAGGADPALVILDLWLPGMSSGEFVHRLRAARAATVPVLVLSGDLAAQHCGVDAVAPKPVEAPSLVRVVDRLVAARSRAVAGPASGARSGNVFEHRLNARAVRVR
jgi:CheY-like chemotaxis protein